MLNSVTVNGIISDARLSIHAKNKLTNYEFVTGPVFHHSNNHWTLFFINMRTAEIFHVDSLQDSTKHDMFYERLFVNWTKATTKFSDLKNIMWKKQPIMPHSSQTDGYNCGIFLLKFFSLLRIGNTNLVIDNFEPQKFRDEVDQAIQRHVI